MTDQDDARELFGRASAAYQGAHYEQAADLFTDLLLHPGFPADSMREVEWNLGMCYFRLGNAELGRQHMEAGGYREQDYRDALGDVRTQQAQDVFARATAAYQGGQYEQAADLFAEVLLEPGLPADSMREIHWNLGMCYFRLGNEQLGHEHMAAGGYSESDYADALRDLHAQAGN